MKFLFAFLMVCLLVCCRTETWYRTPTGLEYQLFPSGHKDSVARMGRTAKVQFTEKVGDSVIETTVNKMPLYFMVTPGFGNRYNPLEVFDYGLRKGDSVVTLQLVDSMLHKKIFEHIPAWMKKTDRWITTFTVLDVFTKDSLLQADKAREAQRVTKIQTALGKERIQSWLEKNNVNAVAWGDIYTEILQAGTGAAADSGNKVRIQFEVKTLRGKLLNSTTDTSFHQPGPKEVTLGSRLFPPVLEKEVEKMRAGGMVRVYLPAVLLFGVNPPEKQVSLDDDIIFTITLVEVINK